LADLEYILVEPDEEKKSLAEKVGSDLGNLLTATYLCETDLKFVEPSHLEALAQRRSPQPSLMIVHFGDLMQSQFEREKVEPGGPEESRKRALEIIANIQRRTLGVVGRDVPAVVSVSLTGSSDKGKDFDWLAWFEEKDRNPVLFPCPSPEGSSLYGCPRTGSARDACSERWATREANEWRGEPFCALRRCEIKRNVYFHLVMDIWNRGPGRPCVRPAITHREEHRFGEGPDSMCTLVRRLP